MMIFFWLVSHVRSEDEGLIATKQVRNYEKIVYIKTFLKMASGRMHTLHPTSQAINQKNHQKSPAYFTHLAPLILFFFIKRPSQKGVGA